MTFADEEDIGTEVYVLTEDRRQQLGSIMIKGGNLRIYTDGLKHHLAFAEHEGVSTTEALLWAADLLNQQVKLALELDEC